MSLKNILFKDSLPFFVDIVVRPQNAFKRVLEVHAFPKVAFIFGLAELITLVKSFYARRVHHDFFLQDWINQTLSVMSNPLIGWLVSLLGYILLLYSAHRFTRIFNKQASFRSLVLACMSVAVLGVMSHILFYALHFSTPNEWLVWAKYGIYAWVWVLSIVAISKTQHVTFAKASISFVAPAIILVFFWGLAVTAPYLAWLTRS